MKITKALLSCSLLTLISHNTLAETAVAMPDRFSAEVATEIMDQGGNAVDAAIAAAFVLSVTYPEAGNIGGGGFMLTYMDKQAEFLDYRETAPQHSTKTMYLNDQGDVIENSTLIGGLASGVPGTVAGMWAAHKKYGSLSWPQLLEPAIKLAHGGFYVPKSLSEEASSYIESSLSAGTNFKEHFNGLTKTGALFTQPELAATLERISKFGPKGFYQGRTADLIVAQSKRTNGIITSEDLAGYQPVWRSPIAEHWRDRIVLSAPPPSSGGIAVVQILKMKALRDDLFRGVEHNSAQYIHLMAEIEKRVYADRAEYLGDPDFVDVPVTKLLEEAYLITRSQSLNSSVPTDFSKIKPGLYESPQTTHFSIVDDQGNAVSNTYTLNLAFGSGNVVEGGGFLLNNEMDDFSAKPGVPNAFGVVGGDANAVAPNKRMLSSMSPTIVLKAEEVEIVTGTPGGSTIITSVAQSIINYVDFDMSTKQAVVASRIHHQLLPINEIKYSLSLPQDTKAELESRGYRLKPGWLGDIQMITQKSGSLSAASDPRGRGVAIVR